MKRVLRRQNAFGERDPSTSNR